MTLCVFLWRSRSFDQHSRTPCSHLFCRNYHLSTTSPRYTVASSILVYLQPQLTKASMVHLAASSQCPVRPLLTTCRSAATQTTLANTLYQRKLSLSCSTPSKKATSRPRISAEENHRAGLLSLLSLSPSIRVIGHPWLVQHAGGSMSWLKLFLPCAWACVPYHQCLWQALHLQQYRNHKAKRWDDTSNSQLVHVKHKSAWGERSYIALHPYFCQGRIVRRIYLALSKRSRAKELYTLSVNRPGRRCVDCSCGFLSTNQPRSQFAILLGKHNKLSWLLCRNIESCGRVEKTATTEFPEFKDYGDKMTWQARNNMIILTLFLQVSDAIV